jgi:hypothetical protein
MGLRAFTITPGISIISINIGLMEYPRMETLTMAAQKTVAIRQLQWRRQLQRRSIDRAVCRDQLQPKTKNNNNLETLTMAVQKTFTIMQLQ